VAVKKTAATRVKFDKHVSSVGRDVDIQNSVEAAFGKEILPLDLAGLKAGARSVALLSLGGRGAIHFASSQRIIVENLRDVSISELTSTNLNL
jgi:hypothetical protein